MWPPHALADSHSFPLGSSTHIHNDIRSSIPTGECAGTHAGLLRRLKAAAEQVHDTHLSDPSTVTSTATRGRASPGHRYSSQRSSQPPGGADGSGRTGTRKGRGGARRKKPPGCRPRVRPGAFSTRLSSARALAGPQPETCSKASKTAEATAELRSPDKYI